jgi:hypothetical protein
MRLQNKRRERLIGGINDFQADCVGKKPAARGEGKRRTQQLRANCGDRAFEACPETWGAEIRRSNAASTRKDNKCAAR